MFKLKGADMEMIKDVVREAGVKAGFTAVCKKSLLTSGGHFDLDMGIEEREQVINYTLPTDCTSS